MDFAILQQRTSGKYSQKFKRVINVCVLINLYSRYARMGLLHQQKRIRMQMMRRYAYLLVFCTFKYELYVHVIQFEQLMLKYALYLQGLSRAINELNDNVALSEFIRARIVDLSTDVKTIFESIIDSDQDIDDLPKILLEFIVTLLLFKMFKLK